MSSWAVLSKSVSRCLLYFALLNTCWWVRRERALQPGCMIDMSTSWNRYLQWRGGNSAVGWFTFGLLSCPHWWQWAHSGFFQSRVTSACSPNSLHHEGRANDKIHIEISHRAQYGRSENNKKEVDRMPPVATDNNKTGTSLYYSGSLVLTSCSLHDQACLRSKQNTAILSLSHEKLQELKNKI